MTIDDQLKDDMVTSSDYGTEVLAHAGMRATLITVFY
jgi:hypothetical protein